MALTELTAPAALPSAQADYVNQNILLTSASLLDPHKIFSIDFDNDEIPQGTILNVGGAILKADTAETVTGTASNFVKIDATAKTASYVASLSGVTWNSVYNGYYSGSDLYLFDEATAYFDGDISTRQMIYAKLRKQIFEEIGVTKPNWTFSIELGSPLTIAAMSKPALTTLNENTVAYADTGNGELRTYEWDGDAWSLVGAGLPIAAMNTSKISSLNSTDIAYYDSGNKDLRVYRFNGATWSQVGTDLNLATASSASLAALNSTDIAFIDDNNHNLTTYRFNGTIFSQVGLVLSVGTFVHNICKLTSTTIAHLDTTNEDLKTYEWNGSSWAQLGNTYPVGGGFAVAMLASLSDIDIIFINGTDDLLTIFRWDGLDWNLISIGIKIVGIGNLGITTLFEGNISFAEDNGNTLSYYHYLNEPKVF